MKISFLSAALSTLALLAPNILPVADATNVTSALANDHGEAESGMQLTVSRNLQTSRRRCRRQCRANFRRARRRACLADCNSSSPPPPPPVVNPPPPPPQVEGPQKECLLVTGLGSLNGDWRERRVEAPFNNAFSGFDRGQRILFSPPTSGNPNAVFFSDRAGLASGGSCILPDRNSIDIELCNGRWVDSDGNLVPTAKFTIEPSLCRFF